ncbi:hypothetical protein [Steroidobacter agaridevorans]|uniref:hypothetical protein n=1 Tax=Steroidobacter agaridevorans TaxID=2695856 RepID=UPI00137AB37D|nr:hypothetical protein [Steroidobacter agaridevorans]
MTNVPLHERSILHSGEAAAVRNQFKIATYMLICASVAAIGALVAVDLTSAALVAATLFGWSEVDGLCGTSHVGTLSPLRVLSKRMWVKSVSAYTAGGLATAACVGMSVGAVGQLAQFGHPYISVLMYALVSVVSLGLAARELNLIQFPLPQIHRQTHKAWASEFGVAKAAGMWGCHIGLAFATVVQHGGFYVVVLLAAVLGPSKGGLLFATYWFGRTLPMWFAGTLPIDRCTAPELNRLLLENRAVYRHAAAAGLLCIPIIALLLGVEVAVTTD